MKQRGLTNVIDGRKDEARDVPVIPWPHRVKTIYDGSFKRTACLRNTYDPIGFFRGEPEHQTLFEMMAR